MIPKAAIEKAIEGGWSFDGPNSPKIVRLKKLTASGKAMFELEGYYQGHGKALTEIALDPSFWQALGKALGWEEKTYYEISCEARNYQCYEETSDITWKYHAREFYNLILTGGDTEKFWEELLNSNNA